MDQLPIASALPDIRRSIAAHGSLVLEAPPGAGKTTLVPIALLEEQWLAGQRIVMLEPRRLATRAAAHRLAELLGEDVGQTVGYRMRGDSRVGKDTRVEVVTEGVLTRRLQRDPTLEGVGLVIFDEFHERSLDADLGLALTLRTKSVLREELAILVMSATLDGASVAALIGTAPVVRSEGRSFPVETRYREPRRGGRIEQAVTAAVVSALADHEGDLLVFLPGAAEIKRVESALIEIDLDAVLVLPLFGALPYADQDRAIRPDPAGRRKIVLTTSIAETSLTIEGIRIVIDSGLSRVPRFSPRTGMTRLETVRVSRASADQRRGRAGRLGPGVCYRLWAEHEQSSLLAATTPEILSSDLAPLALDLAAAGVEHPDELRWLDPPPPSAYSQALELLTELEALDASGRISATGRAMNGLGVHPRIAHMLLRAREQGSMRLACDVAALLEERDVLRGIDGPADADLGLRVNLLRHATRDSATRDTRPAARGVSVDNDALRRVRREAERLARQLGGDDGSAANALSVGELVSLAYPDRVGQRRPGARARYLLRNGRGAELIGAQSLSESPYIVAVDLDDQRPESRVFLAAPISFADVTAIFADQVVVEDSVEMDETTGLVQARRRQRLGAIVLSEVQLARADPGLVADALLAAVRQRGLPALPWSDGARRFRSRVAFVAHWRAEWPDVSDTALLERLDDWLRPAIDGMRRWSDLQTADLTAALASLLDWRQRRELDELAPTHLEVPTGSKIAVDYTDPDSPALAVRIQEVFGLIESPRVLGGKVPVTMQLLSPAHRPVQVTRDLAGFWRTSYFDVRKDLRGRYPKHEWPENPLEATPTRRAKPR